MVRNLAVLMILIALAASAMAQPSPSGVLYATDFNNWSLPQGTSPTSGLISYPTQDLCRVSSNGYSFTAPKAGRPLMIQDANPSLSETFTPTSVFVGPSGCTISGVMAHTHISYTVRSATYGAQEALDYQATYSQGAVVVLTPAWTAAGGTTGVLSTLKGATSLSLLDQRTATITPYNWNGSQYVAQPFGSGSINPGSSYQLPVYPSGSAASVGPSNITTDVTGNNLNAPGILTGTQGVNGPLRDKGGEKYNLLAFGAVSDAKVSKQCSMTAGSNVLTCDDASCTSADIGKAISVQYAGVAEAGPINGNLETTITGCTGSAFTLAANASNTTPSGLIDIEGPGALVLGGAGNQDLGPGKITSQASATVTGDTGQTCLMTAFNNGGTTATATVLLNAANTVNGSNYLVTAGGGGVLTLAPTSATLSSGTATCSGTVTISSMIDNGFGYYSGQWPTTTNGSGTGATLSIYANMMGGGVNPNYWPPHYIVNQGTGYAVGDLLYPNIPGADGAGVFKIFKVDKAAAIWGTDNYTAFANWLAACNGTKNCFIPSAQFLVTAGPSNSHHINFASNTSVNQDPAGAVYVIGVQPGYCTTAGWSVFGTADGTTTNPTQNIHIHGLHLEGEFQTPGQYAFGCGPRAFNIGSYNRNIEIEGSTFNHHPGAAIAAFSAGGAGIKIHDNYCDQTGDSCFNINAEGVEITHNTLVNTPGQELGGGPGLIVANNIDYNGFGVSQIAAGGASAGEPYYGGQVIANQIINPLKNGINVTSAFSKGLIALNVITGVTNTGGSTYGILQGGCSVTCSNNTYVGNVVETPANANLSGYAGISITNSPLLGGLGATLTGNTARGYWNLGITTSGIGLIVGSGNTWEGNPSGISQDFQMTSGNYTAVGDTLIHGRFSWRNADRTSVVKGTFVNGVTGEPMMIGSANQTQIQGDQSTSAALAWLTASGALQGYGLQSIQLAAPLATGVFPQGTTGSTTYTYYCTAVSWNGIETPAGASTSTSTGNATLSSTNYNKVICPITIGANTYNFYRSVGGSSQGRIWLNFPANVTFNSVYIYDTGLTATAVSPPATNLTGGFKLGGTYYAPNTLCQSNGTNCPAAGSTVTLVASGSLALATNSIAAAPGCQAITAGSVNSATATGATVATDVLTFSPTTSLSAVTGYTSSTSGGLNIVGYITAGFVNFDVCNWTASAIIPGAVTVNWKVMR